MITCYPSDSLEQAGHRCALARPYVVLLSSWLYDTAFLKQSKTVDF